MTKQRLSIPLSPSLYNEIQKKSEQMGVTMSSYVSFIVANHLQTEIRMVEAISNKLGLSVDDFVKLNLKVNANDSGKVGE